MKRGFNVEIIYFDENKNRLEFKTSNFQTTPVLFQEIIVCNFSSFIFKETINEKEFDCFRIGVHVSYKHFGGGSNGCSLFDLYGVLSNDRVYDFKIL